MRIFLLKRYLFAPCRCENRPVHGDETWNWNEPYRGKRTSQVAIWRPRARGGRPGNRRGRTAVAWHASKAGGGEAVYLWRSVRGAASAAPDGAFRQDTVGRCPVAEAAASRGTGSQGRRRRGRKG